MRVGCRPQVMALRGLVWRAGAVVVLRRSTLNPPGRIWPVTGITRLCVITDPPRCASDSMVRIYGPSHRGEIIDDDRA